MPDTVTTASTPTTFPPVTILSAAHVARVAEVGPEEAAKPLPPFTAAFTITRRRADG